MRCSEHLSGEGQTADGQTASLPVLGQLQAAVGSLTSAR